MMPVVWVDKVTSLCVERMVVLFLQFIHELSGNGRPPLTEDEVARVRSLRFAVFALAMSEADKQLTLCCCVQ